MFKRILVPLDGSRLAEQALEPALRIAHRTAGEIWLLRVPAYSDAGIPDISEYDLHWVETSHDQAADQAADYLREIKRGLKTVDIAVHTAVVEGDCCQAIVNTAAGENIDLIVMATHGRAGLARLVLGSVACEVMREAPCPVLILHRELKLSHIIVALDGSELAEEALRPALALAEEFDSAVTLLRVCGHGPGDRTEAERYLDGIKLRYRQFPRIETAAPGWGAAGPGLVRYAEEQNGDVIAMTTRGHHGWRRLVSGSVVEEVTRHTRGAVLVVPPRT